MNTEAPPIPVPTKPYVATRGGWYLLEALLQLPEPFTKKGATRRALRLRRKIRLANPAEATIDGEVVKFERQFARREGESEGAWANRQIQRSEAWEVWQQEMLTLELTKKEQLFLVGSIKWALDHRDKVWPVNNEHVLSLLEAFPSACDDESINSDDEEDDEDE